MSLEEPLLVKNLGSFWGDFLLIYMDAGPNMYFLVNCRFLSGIDVVRL